jgi:hypothetical protein
MFTARRAFEKRKKPPASWTGGGVDRAGYFPML